MPRYLIHNTVTGETQEVEVVPSVLGENEVNRGEIPSTMPPGCASWDGTDITCDLDPIKGGLLTTISKQRVIEEEAGFTSATYGTFDTDLRSQTRILLAAVAATAQPQGFTRTWTRADNSPIVLDAEDMIALAAELSDFLNSQHIHKQSLEEDVETAETMEELEAIDPCSGWA